MCAFENLGRRWPAISIKQPWAELILSGKKDVEVRSWATHYRGPLWLHTGLKVDDYATKRFELGPLFTGGIVGWANLDGIRPFSAASWRAWAGRHCDDGAFDEERAKYGWILRGAVRAKTPVSAKGQIGLFPLDAAVVNQLQLENPACKEMR